MKRSTEKSPEQAESEDMALFRAAIGAVQPLPQQNRIGPQRLPRRAIFRQPLATAHIPDNLSDFSAESAPEEYLSNGLSRMTLRKLRRGTWPIQDRLDLHGNNSDAARKLLLEFLHQARQRDLRCVLVIHGKGMNSQGGQGVLRKLTRHWLTQHAQVLAYCDAPPGEGGSGAVVLLLKAATSCDFP
ncbi:MAG: Smr/MutS family protein [Nitrosomonadales bacterium]|nr:Smr/MutS family protein [Nitrosomonadales bacterium]